MKQFIPTVLFAAAGLIAPVSAQPAPAPSSAPAASALPPEVQAAIDRAKATAASQPASAARGGAAQPMMPNLLATSKATADATIGIVSMNESRPTNGIGQISFSLAVTGGNFPAGSTVRRTTVSNALDDKDRSLLSNNARGGVGGSALAFSNLMNANSRLMSAAMMAARGGIAAGAAVMQGNASLASSRRDATAIKQLEGEIEVFTPSATNGSMLTIKDVMSQMGKPLDHPALAKEGIELILVNSETFGTVRDRLGNLPPAAVAAGVTQPDPTFANGPGVFVHDPAGKLAGFIFQDAAGTVLQTATAGTRTSPGGDFMMELRFMAAAPANAQLVIYVAVPEAAKVLPFRFENVALP